MKKTLLTLATATAILAALPASAEAKLRGCDYRLRSINEAELALDHAQQRGTGIGEARAQLARARTVAFEEGCLIEKARWDGDRRPHWDDRRQVARERFDYLKAAGYRRGLSRKEFRELEDLRDRFRF
jgi:hypothetical protein